MDAATIGRLRAQLEQDRLHVAAELVEYEREGREKLSDASGENNYRDHMADQGTATFTRELDMTLIDAVRERLERIDRALARIDAGTYGVCTRCGAAIVEERLDAMPSAELCIGCKEWEESRS